jgi:hypothetical protein
VRPEGVDPDTPAVLTDRVFETNEDGCVRRDWWMVIGRMSGLEWHVVVTNVAVAHGR